jgi:hypothetical protein
MNTQDALITAFALVILAIPFWKMYDKTGVNKGWLIVILVPVIGYFVVWLVLAVSAWPNLKRGTSNGDI